MLAVVEGALLVLFALPVLALAVPLQLAFDLRAKPAVEGEVRMRWLFGLVRLRRRIEAGSPGQDQAEPVPGLDAAVAAAARPPDDRPRGQRRPRAPRARRGDNAAAVLRRADFRARVWQFVGDLFAALHPRDLAVSIRLGLSDPADTGRLWGLVGPVALLAGAWPHGTLRIEPDFNDAAIELASRGRLTLIPLQVLALSIGFVLSPASLRAWRTWRAHD